MEWWISFARMKLAQKLISEAQTDAEKVSAKNQCSRYDEHMVWHITAEHKARYGFDEKTVEDIVSLLKPAIYLGLNKKDWIKARQLLKNYYVKLFSNLNKKD
jgi:hypothetical protein